MPPKFVNTFMVGADPEFIFLNPPNLVNTQREARNLDPGGLFGWDHNGFVVEPHPAPNVSARTVVANIRKGLDYLHYKFPNYRMRAGAWLTTPERNVSLGGHVHLDMGYFNAEQMQAMDNVTRTLEHFDILPTRECRDRREQSGAYGGFSDSRHERGRSEYRSMCSWLFHPKVSLLSITCIKLAAVNPDGVRSFRNWNLFTGWLEGFRTQDDDVRWMFDRNYFDNIQALDPDANLSTVWRCTEERGKEVAAELASKATTSRLTGAHVRAARQTLADRVIENLERATQAERRARERLLGWNQAVATF